MSLRLDPRHLGQLKRLAADAGLRPGELALQWMIERLDAESGRPPQTAAPRATPSQAGSPDLLARLDALSARIDALEARSPMAPRRAAPTPKAEAAPAEAPSAAEAPAEAHAAPSTETAPPAAEPEPDHAAAPEPAAAPPEPRRRSTPAPRTPSPRATASAEGERVGLHDEIAAVIGERGPMTAADLAVAIVERGRYVAPRSTKPLDAATVNSRVSNPAYRGRFTRNDGRIGLTDAG